MNGTVTPLGPCPCCAGKLGRWETRGRASVLHDTPTCSTFNSVQTSGVLPVEKELWAAAETAFITLMKQVQNA